jgi:iron complex transport system substrate-binding protein
LSGDKGFFIAADFADALQLIEGEITMFRRLSATLLPGMLALGLLLGACTPASTPAPTATAAPPTAVPTAAPTIPPAPTAEPMPAPLVLTDFLGREVTLDAPAQRIVSLAPSNTEIVFAIGAGDRLVGRDEFSDYPPEAAGVTSIGSLYPNVNAEAVVALEPDLVLAAGITSPDDVTLLADLGLTVYATSIAEDLDDIYADILAVGQLTGRVEQAESLVADLRARVTRITDLTRGVAEKPLVFYEIDATEPSKPWTAGPGTFVDVLITLAGGLNAGNVAREQYFQISLEQLVAEDPDIIVLGSATYGGQTPELVAARAGWENLSAVVNGAVYTFDDNLVSRPGPRVVDGLEELAKLIHPDLFP